MVVAARFKNMKEKILKHLGKKASLDEKLNFLTSFGLYTKKDSTFRACEEIRAELISKEMEENKKVSVSSRRQRNRNNDENRINETFRAE